MFVFFSIFLNIKDLFLFLDPRDIVLYTQSIVVYQAAIAAEESDEGEEAEEEEIDGDEEQDEEDESDDKSMNEKSSVAVGLKSLFSESLVGGHRTLTL